MVWVKAEQLEQLGCMGAFGAKHSLPQTPLWATGGADSSCVSLRDSRE